MDDENARSWWKENKVCLLEGSKFNTFCADWAKRVFVPPCARCSHDKKNAQPSLLDFPSEIFLHICSFLDASTIVYGLRLVCKQFYLILKDDQLMWKARINCIWPGASHSLLYPVRPDKLFWKSSCIAIEKQTALWKQQDSMEKLINADQHSYYIRALLLMHDGTTCIAGTKNGTLVYWKLPSCEKLPSDEIKNTVCTESAHNGCICGLTAIDNTIYSCSYRESVIKSWMLTNTSLVRQTSYETYRVPCLACRDRRYGNAILKFTLRQTVLPCIPITISRVSFSINVKYSRNVPDALVCVSSCPERSLFATGSESRTIFVFDSRSHNLIRQYRPHIGPVQKLAMSTNYILSASLDKTVSVWDQRAGRTMKSITIPGKGFPHCMSMQRDWVFVGDTDAKCHMLNPKNDFKLVKSYSTEHTQWITGVHLTHGCLITSSRDGTVRISSPTDPPKPLATLHSAVETIENMDYLNDTLAISGRGVITVWRPKSKKYQ